ncbi:fat storage-inducing transmembrane protein 2 [Boothiomyces sp. JEL0866]|nr:fat storage-inducing transmembrane protein 2 [Boothiomyces sp. JEL0866]
MEKDQKTIVSFYLSLVIIFSFISLILPSHSTFFNDKHNPLNQYFVKQGWAWTLASTISIQLVSFKTRKQLIIGLVRIVLASVHWQVSLFIMSMVLHYTGTCSIEYSDIYACKNNGGVWSGFDISGHCYLLIHSSLVILEEFKQLPKLKPEMNPIVAFVGISSCALLILWIIMLIATCLYFHPFLEVVVGSALGVSWWFAFYIAIGKLYPLIVPKRRID